jgi:uncharacterized protein YjbJ (UPF0337 family)
MTSGTGDTLKGQAREALDKGKAGLGNGLGNEQLAGEGQADQVQGNVSRRRGPARTPSKTRATRSVRSASSTTTSARPGPHRPAPIGRWWGW